MSADLDLYSIFCTVARCGSLSNAAKELYVSQPAVSQSMHRLEYILGCKLFTRTSRGVALTNEGKILYSYADKAISLIDSAENKIISMRTLQTGCLTIGASDTLCQYYLLNHLEEFHKCYPDLRLQVINRTTPETVDLVKTGKVDIALVNLPVLDKALTVRECLKVHDVFVASSHFSDMADRKISWNELASKPLILLEKASNSRKYIDSFAERHGIILHPEIELGAHALLIEFARIGLGIACITKEYADTQLPNSGLFELELEAPPPPRAIGLITLEGVSLSAAATKFIEIIMDKVNIV